jgi:hypothetical protein
VIAADQATLAVRALHDGFGLGAGDVTAEFSPAAGA